MTKIITSATDTRTGKVEEEMEFEDYETEMDVDTWILDIYCDCKYRNGAVDFEECSNPESNLGDECCFGRCPKICEGDDNENDTR